MSKPMPDLLMSICLHVLGCKTCTKALHQSIDENCIKPMCKVGKKLSDEYWTRYADREEARRNSR